MKARPRDITRESVNLAIDEFDRLGRSVFLKQYGFGEAQAYLLFHDGRKYDSKAIVGVAHGFCFGIYLRSADFNSGLANVVKPLRSLGFYVPDPPLDVDEGAKPGEGAERLRKLTSVIFRPQQAAFRHALIDRYGARCQITGCPVMGVVQACHLDPVAANGSDAADNGILLRIDLHVLFDSNYIGIVPDTLVIRIHPSLNNTRYDHYNGSRLLCNHGLLPSAEALSRRWRDFQLSAVEHD